MRTKAFGYLRVSSDGQAKENKNGFHRQEQTIMEYAKANGIEIVGFFKDGITGTSEDRPALYDMLVSMQQNGHDIKTVVIEKLDRLARDLMVQENIIRDFQKDGFQLISTTEGSDLGSNDPTRKFIRQIMGAVAEYDKATLVMKLKASRERKKRLTGKCEGRKSYNESDQGRELIKRIQRMRRKPKYRKRMTYQQIADQLNDEGVKTLNGMSWTLFRVQQLLKPYTQK